MNIKLVLEPFTHDQIQLILKTKPSCVLLQGEIGTGAGRVAKFIAAEILQINEAKVDSSENYIFLDGNSAGIDELRDLIKTLQYTVPGTAAIRRMVVIANFDRFHHEAQNASLKTLEEPPLNTMIILTASDFRKVLPTVISRVHTIKIPPVSYETALKAYPSAEENAFKRSYYMSGGEAGLLHELLDEDNQHELVRAILTAKNLLQLPKYRRIAEIDRLLKNNDLETDLLLEGFLRVLEAAYRQVVSSSNSSLATIKSSRDRLEMALSAMEELKSGLTKKLVLTRLFIAL